MKTNKIIIALGMVLLISKPLVLRSMTFPVKEKSDPSVLVSHKITEPQASDDEILAGREFEKGPVESAPYGLPRYSPSKRSWADIRNEYNKWASLDEEGAAADVSLPNGA